MTDQERIANLEQRIDKLSKKHQETTLILFILKKHYEFIMKHNPDLRWPTIHESEDLNLNAIDAMNQHGYEIKLGDPL